MKRRVTQYLRCPISGEPLTLVERTEGARGIRSDRLLIAAGRDYAIEEGVPCCSIREAMTKLGKALSELRVEIDVPVDIPLLGIYS